jgi:hypothetical protein
VGSNLRSRVAHPQGRYHPLPVSPLDGITPCRTLLTMSLSDTVECGLCWTLYLTLAEHYSGGDPTSTFVHTTSKIAKWTKKNGVDKSGRWISPYSPRAHLACSHPAPSICRHPGHCTYCRLCRTLHSYTIDLL